MTRTLSDLDVWGPAMWRALHTVSFTPDRGGHLRFFEALPDALPCPACGLHLKEIYERLPIDVSSVPACSEWLWRVHNEVNASLAKNPGYSYADLVRDYTVGVPPVPQRTNRIWVVFALLGTLLLLYIMFRMKRCKAPNVQAIPAA
jgi:hypothetical protein